MAIRPQVQATIDKYGKFTKEDWATKPELKQQLKREMDAFGDLTPEEQAAVSGAGPMAYQVGSKASDGGRGNTGP